MRRRAQRRTRCPRRHTLAWVTRCRTGSCTPHSPTRLAVPNAELSNTARPHASQERHETGRTYAERSLRGRRHEQVLRLVGHLALLLSRNSQLNYFLDKCTTSSEWLAFLATLDRLGDKNDRKCVDLMQIAADTRPSGLTRGPSDKIEATEGRGG